LLRVGITGGIGSGKSTACHVFEKLGVPVYYADAVAKSLYAENQDLRDVLLKNYGPQVLEKDGSVSKSFLREQAFGSNEKSQKLNAIVHPFVFEDYEKWCNAHANCSYTIKEAAILFESGSYKRLHRVVGVVAPEALRIARVMARDHCSREDVLLRMQQQMPQDELVSKCHYIINNDEKQSILEQVMALHRQLLTDASCEWPFMS
jgi:dephospho-CoA kinase